MAIPVAFRAHVKNDQRLAVTKQTIESAIDVELNRIAILHLIDDHSHAEYAEKLQDFCLEKGVRYIRAGGQPHTRNGLVESLKVVSDEPILCCVDDIIFAKKAPTVITDIYRTYIPKLEKQNVNWGLIGMFACYNRDKYSKKYDLPLWELPTDCIYALVAHFFNPKLSNILKQDWSDILEGKKELTAYQDDLWTAKHMTDNGMIYLNTNVDYVQHVGEYLRSFGPNNGGDNSCYKTDFFDDK